MVTIQDKLCAPTPRLLARIGSELRTSLAPTLKEPLPPTLRDLCDQLARKCAEPVNPKR